MAERQRTVSRPTGTITGVGLHSGAAGAVRLEPAPAGAGLAFRRTDLPGAPDIPARVECVESTARCVALSRGPARVSTVEHVLAACVFAGLDNAVIAVEGPEIPAVDGSALPFLDLIEEAGLREQEADRRFLVLADRIEASRGTAGISAEPAPAPLLMFRFRGMASLDGREARWGGGGLAPREVAAARTFCFEEEVGPLLEAGLGRGGSLETVLVLRRDGSAVNSQRVPDEPLRHKLLDLAGDMALAGASMRAAVTADGSGHALHVEFLRKIMVKQANKEGTLPDA